MLLIIPLLKSVTGWTLGGAIQKTMDVYVNRYTFQEIERVSTKLVSSAS